MSSWHQVVSFTDVVRFMKSAITVGIACLAVLISLTVVILQIRNSRLIDSENADLKEQILKLQQQVKQKAKPVDKTTRNQLLEFRRVFSAYLHPYSFKSL